MVGAAGLEPAISCAQGKRDTRLRHAPTKTFARNCPEQTRQTTQTKQLAKYFACAQGRCATRLRYAPTFAGLFILDHFQV
jgi:hypothetical protein